MPIKIMAIFTGLIYECTLSEPMALG